MAESTILIAKILGPMLMILSLAVMVKPYILETILFEVSASKTTIFFVSTWRIIIGLIIVTIHNSWTGFIDSIISLLAWIIIVLGLMGLFFPEDAVLFTKPIIKQKNIIQTLVTFFFLLGASLVFVGYGATYSL